MSEIIIKVEGKKLEFFDNVSYSTKIDSISSTLSFNTFYDIKTYEFAEIEVIRNNILIFTGLIFGKSSPDEAIPKPFNYKCYSLTGILEDSALPLELYPLQSQSKTIKEIIVNICDYFNIIVKFDSNVSSDVSKVYEFKDQSPDMKAVHIINNICSENDLILSHNSKGNLLITNKVGNESNGLKNVLRSNKNYNYRKFYNKYLILGQQSIDNDTTRQAESVFSNIDEKRNTTKVQNDGDSEISQKQANSFKFDSYKANTYKIDVHDDFINVGEIHIIDNVKSICNEISYSFRAGSEVCSANLLNYKIYQRL